MGDGFHELGDVFKMDSMKWGMDSMDWGMDSILFVDGFHIFFIPFFHKSPLRSMWAGFI